MAHIQDLGMVAKVGRVVYAVAVDVLKVVEQEQIFQRQGRAGAIQAFLLAPFKFKIGNGKT
jgi:hypothetical protein